MLEDDGEGAKVKVNLPLSLAEVALKMASKVENEYISNGQIRIDNAEISVRDIRILWKELKNAGDAEFVSIEEDDEVIKVFRDGDYVHVNVDSRYGDEKVRMELPVNLVDALLDSEGETIDLAAAFDELGDSHRGDIIRIQDGSDFVRVWVD